jgi:hypothetical protein
LERQEGSDRYEHQKSLIALAAMALAMKEFASMAMATDGVIRDVTSTSTQIPNGRILHFVGSTKFVNAANEGFECHMTWVLKTHRTRRRHRQVTNVTVPNLANCTGTGPFNGCTLTSKQATNLPYNVTTIRTDFDVTGTIVIEYTWDPNCLIRSAELTFSAITLKPPKTGTDTITGTAGRLGTTAAAGTSAADGDAITGVELSVTGEIHAIDFLGGHSSLNPPIHHV